MTTVKSYLWNQSQIMSVYFALMRFNYICVFLNMSQFFFCRVPVDYELPEVLTKDIQLPDFPEEEPVKVKFKEKRVTCLSHSSDVTAVAFKKRKITKGARNMRSRDDPDD